MIETVANIENERRARLERAQNFDALTGRKLSLQVTISRLEDATNLDALRQILELCPAIPAGLTTAGAYGFAGGASARDVIQLVVLGAIEIAQRRADKRSAELTAARAALAEVELALAAMTAAE